MKTTRKNSIRYCEICGTKMQRKGTYANGIIRLYCPGCHKSVRFGKKAAKETKKYHWDKKQQKIIKSKLTLSEQGISYSTYYRHKDVGIIQSMSFYSPSFVDAISLDATWVGGLCYLFATFRIETPKEYPLKFEIVKRENSVYWANFIQSLPKTNVYVCDGQKGLLKAIKLLYPNAKIQLCLVHITRRVKTCLTKHPQSEAGKELLAITNFLERKIKHNDLYSINTISEIWTDWLDDWYERYKDFILEKTYSESGRWFRTHRSVWSAYRTLKRNLDNKRLFTFIFEPNVPRTTNGLEGGINSQIKSKMRYHLGSNFDTQNKIIVSYLKEREKKN